jgi:hypothetical protein
MFCLIFAVSLGSCSGTTGQASDPDSSSPNLSRDLQAVGRGDSSSDKTGGSAEKGLNKDATAALNLDGGINEVVHESTPVSASTSVPSDASVSTFDFLNGSIFQFYVKQQDTPNNFRVQLKVRRSSDGDDTKLVEFNATKDESYNLGTFCGESFDGKISETINNGELVFGLSVNGRKVAFYTLKLLQEMPIIITKSYNNNYGFEIGTLF